jgi:preprotein translocase subunit SecG
MMYEIVIALYLLVSIAIIGLVLIQHGKGADMGASFGAGASATLFGSSGTGNFLTRSTTVLATVFFALSLILGNYNISHIEKKSEFENIVVPTEQVKPAVEEKKDTTKDIPVGN